ncbi:CPBP family intramembrane glutamic endopeptidase [Cellulomonas sp. P5_C6]
MSTDRRPSVRAAFVAFLVYAAIFVGGVWLSGIGYEHLFDTTETTLRGAVLPLAAGSVWLVVFLRWTRWDHVFRDGTRLPMGRFLWVLPIAVLALSALRLAGADWRPVTAAYLGALLLASVLVGFAEETLFRGIILRALRETVRTEGSVALLSSLWFGAFHLVNLLLGEPGAVLQLVFATLTGTAFYLARRGTGSIVAAMVLHGFWDLSTFLAGTYPGDGALADAANFLTTVIYPLALVTLVVLVVRGRRERVAA